MNQEVVRWLGRHPRNKNQVYRNLEIGRNDLCSCGSKMKYKYCCEDQQNKQRIAQMKINDEIVNITEQKKFEQLIKQGLIVPETSKGTSAKQIVSGKLDF